MKSQKSLNMAIAVSATNEKTVGSIMENTAVGFILLAGGIIATISTQFIFVGAIVIGGIILVKGFLAKKLN